MITKSLSFELPQPWVGKIFRASQIGAINFLVGPNGSGKSRFAETLRLHLGNARILGTDRLSGMEQNAGLKNIFGDHLATGLASHPACATFCMKVYRISGSKINARPQNQPSGFLQSDGWKTGLAIGMVV